MDTVKDSEILDSPHPSQSSTRKRTWYPAAWIWQYFLKFLIFWNLSDSGDFSGSQFDSNHNESILPKLSLIGPTSPLRHLRRASIEERSGQSVFLLFGQSNHCAVEVPCMRPKFYRQIASFCKVNNESPSCDLRTTSLDFFLRETQRTHHYARCWQCPKYGSRSSPFCPACGAPQRLRDCERAKRQIIAILESEGVVEDRYKGFEGKVGYEYVPMKTIESSCEEDCDILSRILERIMKFHGRYSFLLRLARIVSVTEKKASLTKQASERTQC